MRFHRLFITSLVSFNKWAETSPRQAFYAMVNDTFVPLSSSSDYHPDFNYFVYGTKGPTLPIYIRDGTAVAKHRSTAGPVSLFNGFFAFGPSMRPMKMEVDKDNKLLYHAFRRCRIDGTDTWAILYAPTDLHARKCFKVDIYLKPLNETSS